jgi:type I restriction enzyme S subunit
MSSDCQKVSLAPLLVDSTVGFVGSMSPLFVEKGIPLLRGKNIRPFGVDMGDLKFIGVETHRQWRKSQLKSGDVVLVRVGQPGTCCVIPEGMGEINAASLVILRVDTNELDPYFLSVFFNSPEGKRQVDALTVGSVQDVFNVKTANDIEIPSLPLNEQKRISSFIKALNNKIELNRKTNETLEAMAKALFKSWFVDFDPVRAKTEGRPTGLPAEISDLFPDSFEDSELGEIPSGWEVGGLEKFLVLQRGFDLPAPERIKGAYPVVAASGMSGTHNEPMAPAPGVVTGRSGVLGKVFYIQTDFFPLNTTLWAKEFRLATPIYGYFLLCDIDFAVFNAGSAVPTLNRNHLGSLRFSLPPKALIHFFTEVADNLMRRKEGIIAETSNLSATRDALLPKLISGEIRIPDAEKMLEEVGV